MTKKLFIILACLALAGLFFSSGYIAGANAGKEKCIATVTDNCREICGVGAEFCYPDEEESAIEYETEDYLSKLIAGGIDG